MTALFMIFDYGFTFIEVFLFFIILKAIYSDINYKYAFIITLVSACCTTFINQISLFSAFSVIIFVLSTFIGGCILVRKDYFMLLSISAFYVLMMGCYEFCYASLIMHFSSNKCLLNASFSCKCLRLRKSISKSRMKNSSNKKAAKTNQSFEVVVV